VHIEENFRRPLAERMLRFAIAKLIPHPRAFAASMHLARLAAPLRTAMPERMHALLDAVPEKSDAAMLPPQVFPPQGVRRKRVALLAGCAQQVLSANINAATIRLLTRAGCEVVVAAGSGCCGSLTLHMGREADAKHSAAGNILAWTDGAAEPFDAVVVNASGCGTTVKDYGHLFAHDPDIRNRARYVGAITRDVSEILQELGLTAPAANSRPYRVAYHDPCSMQHGQKVTAQPRALLAAAGYRVNEVPEAHFCCGSAGTYNLLQPRMAEVLGRRKADHIASTQPEIVATGNIGCIMQLRRYLATPVVHTVELLDWASGGARPPALEGISAPRHDEKPADLVPQGGANSTGFW
jgi:glycolate oxidase iron-sulfur subunit